MTQQTNLEELKNLATQNKIKNYQVGASSRGGLISIVKATNGTRLTISKEVNQKLGYPKELFIGFEGGDLIIFNADESDVGNVKLKKNDQQKLNIYNTSLVDSIIKEFSLNYTNKTSRSFANGHYEQKGRTILYVKMV